MGNQMNNEIQGNPSNFTLANEPNHRHQQAGSPLTQTTDNNINRMDTFESVSVASLNQQVTRMNIITGLHDNNLQSSSDSRQQQQQQQQILPPPNQDVDMQTVEEIPSINVQSPIRRHFHLGVNIGPNMTVITRKDYEAIDWKLPTDAIQKVLLAVFDRETLATHSLSGKPLPAYRNPKRLLKDKLDPLKVQDIIFMVHGMTGVSERMIRKEITKKCVEECKLLRERIERIYVDVEE